MRIFVAGGSGVIGQPLVRLLCEAGHSVVAMARSDKSAARLKSLGASTVLCDVFDRERLEAVVRDANVELIVDELTDLPDDPAEIAAGTARNARIRREGTANLLAAATAAGVKRFIVQSVAWDLPGDSGQAVREMEAAVLAFGGTVLRYGQFYGVGTYNAVPATDQPSVHVDTAAQQTVELLDRRGEVITIAD